MLSKGYYNAGTLPSITSHQVAKIHSDTLNVYRMVADQSSDGKKHIDTGEQVIQTIHATAQAVMLKMARMALFMCIVAPRPLLLLCLVELTSSFQGSWLAAVLKDFQCHTRMADGLAEMRDWSLWQ